MRRVTIEVESEDLARAASGAPGQSFDTVVHQALHEYAVRHLMRARANEAASKLERERVARPARSAPGGPVS